MSEAIQFSSLDLHFADFIVRIDNNPCEQLWMAAALTSNAAGCGHTCLDMKTAVELNITPFGTPPPTIAATRLRGLENGAAAMRHYRQPGRIYSVGDG